MRDLRPSNLSTFTTALGYSTNVFSDLPAFRNYFAHKGKGTAISVQNVARRYAVPPGLRPSEIMLSLPAGRPQSLLMDWLDDIRNVIELMD